MTLDVNNVTAGYGKITVLRDISMTVAEGDVVGVLGRNGMGKSTLIRCLSGLIKPESGTISLDGKDISLMPPHLRARQGITTVVQARGIFPDLSVAENLKMGQIAQGGNKPDRSSEVFEYFPRLEERLNQRAGTMSGGEQQMLAIGRGLMTYPKIMLLDEPSDGIMPMLVKQIGETLMEINRQEKTTIIIVEQNVQMVFAMVKHCIVMEKGAIVTQGTVEEISESNALHKYLAI